MSKIVTELEGEQYLTGQMLIATHQIQNPRFARTVILICAHDDGGALGLIVNRRVHTFSFRTLASRLGIVIPEGVRVAVPIHFGGPLEIGRGFILHSDWATYEPSLKVADHLFLTSNLESVALLAQGESPEHKFLALGYAGWGRGQLETELEKGAWLQMSADTDLIFKSDFSQIWEKALEALGVSVASLSLDSGRA